MQLLLLQPGHQPVRFEQQMRGKDRPRHLGEPRCVWVLVWDGVEVVGGRWEICGQ